MIVKTKMNPPKNIQYKYISNSKDTPNEINKFVYKRHKRHEFHNRKSTGRKAAKRNEQRNTPAPRDTKSLLKYDQSYFQNV